MAASLRSLAALACIALGSTGCITGGFYRSQMFEPVTQAQLDPLPPGNATLAEALAELGAPLLVWEWKGDGVALAWGWQDAQRWGFAVSIPIWNNTGASLSYDKVARELPGAVLFFGPDGVLIESRQGKLGEIQDQTRARPAAPAEAGS